MPSVTRAKATQERQQQRRQPKKSRPSYPSGSKPVGIMNNPNTTAPRPAPPAPIPQAPPQKEPRFHGKTAAQRADRNARDARRLAAVNGVVIPSRVPPGHAPRQGSWIQDARMVYPCSVCGRNFAVKYHVQVHMAPCVERNGNPRGARWDDAWRNGAGRVGYGHAQASGRHALRIHVGETEDLQMEDDAFEDYNSEAYQPQFYQRQGHRPERRKLPVFLGSLNGPFPTDTFFHNPMHPASPFSASLEQHDPATSVLGSLSLSPSISDIRSVSSTPTACTPYDPYLRMDILTNEALLSMVQAWQDVMQCGWGSYTVGHPHFQRIMEELCRRGLRDRNWTWN
ncbi:MAG: hypothetical protein ASARMPREDX12_006420 [Alectoria sarmentosa]|nr:MAG: hypothetical protein ASARMPREDX12_006420 [Alectoria sarmentosa]